MAEIRPYRASDATELRALFRRAGEGAPTETLWGDEPSEAAVYLTPYLELEPESVFVAVQDGALVGYLTGSLGGVLPDEEERMSAAFREHRVFRQRAARRFFARAALDMLREKVRRRPGPGELDDPRWPAHLHVNVAPEGRGTGAADALLAAWTARLEAAGSPGCYLQTVVENERAVRFFTRHGFVPHGPTPVVPGLRAAGRRTHQQTMVRPAP
jgi:ribosomal protein S18 acetylase RimI-like enzyme